MDLVLSNEKLGVVVTTAGGSVWRFFARRDGCEVPVLREPRSGFGRVAVEAGCFPLVPFGNRVRGNRFVFEDAAYMLRPDTAGDQQALHGDGWNAEWQVLRQEPLHLQLGFSHQASAGPYDYTAVQSFALEEWTLTMALTVSNKGTTGLPFGLGWHPFFPLTPATTLQAQTRSYWEQDETWLPTREQATVGDLDFSTPAPLPRRWANTQFEGWDGQAVVRWPERNLALRIDADPLFDRCVLFMSDPGFDKDYAYDFFCFEPMSHGIDDHNRVGGGGLRRLAPGESLTGSVRFTVIDADGAPHL